MFSFIICFYYIIYEKKIQYSFRNIVFFKFVSRETNFLLIKNSGGVLRASVNRYTKKSVSKDVRIISVHRCLVKK